MRVFVFRHRELRFLFNYSGETFLAKNYEQQLINVNWEACQKRVDVHHQYIGTFL